MENRVIIGALVAAVMAVLSWVTNSTLELKLAVQGLVNRREAEVALFLMPVETVIRPKARSTPTQSRTVQTSVVQGATAASGAVGALSALDGTVQTVAVIGCILIALMSLFILRERLKAWASGWR